MTNRISSLADYATDFELQHDAFGRLVLVRADGTRHVDVEPVRAFPISDPMHGISVCDSEGRELVWIDDLAQLAPPVRHELEAEFAQREFMPQIRRIVSISLQTEPCEWEVETDRGFTKFVLKSEDDIRRLGKNKAMIIDANGIRYLVADTKDLDKHSRSVLERYL
jgi:Domain of unknown function (DUF1854)